MLAVFEHGGGGPRGGGSSCWRSFRKADVVKPVGEMNLPLRQPGIHFNRDPHLLALFWVLGIFQPDIHPLAVVAEMSPLARRKPFTQLHKSREGAVAVSN